MHQYKNLVRDVLENGISSDDRTGTGTKSVFGRQIRFDLSQGFPLVTLKRTFWKGVVVELLWLMRGETNIKFLVDRGVHIWDEWGRFEGTYTPDRIKDWVKNKNIEGHDYNGDYSTKGLNAKRNSIDDKLRNSWVRMMRRCYDKTSRNYNMYGGVGVKVHRDWHNCSTFIEDVKKITNWNNKLINWNDFELDKDYFGSRTYSKETCVWLDTRENNLYTKVTGPIQITLNNKKQVFISLDEASKTLNIPKSSLHRWKTEGFPKSPNKNNHIYKDIEFKDLKKEGFSYRYLFTNGNLGPVYGKSWRKWEYVDSEQKYDSGGCDWVDTELKYKDQLTDAINTIKNNPNSRRIMVSAWNAPMIDKMALPPCHSLFQFYVRDGKLSCQLYQRSADLFLGVPFNIASYSLLTHLIANECGLEVGDFIHTFGDLHIYNNHIPQCEEILNREPKSLPELCVNLQKNSLMTWVDDIVQDQSWNEIQSIISLIGYKSHPTLKGKVSV